MAEACRPTKSKIKESDLLSQLDKLAVPDHEIFSDLNETPVEDDSNTQLQSIPETPELASVTNELLCEQTPELKPPVVKAQLYPQLNEGQETSGEEMRQPMNMRVEAESEVPLEAHSKPLICIECSLPLPLDLTYLENLYINRCLESVTTRESEFLIDTLSAFGGGMEAQTEGDTFEAIVQEYMRCWSQWKYAVDRFNMVCTEAKQLEETLWTVKQKASSVKGKCKDGYNVSLDYTYQEADMNQSNLQELLETEDVMRWVVFEELPVVAYGLARLRNQINEIILDALTQSSIYLNLCGSEPAQLLPSATNEHSKQLRRLRSICNVLFAKLRQQYASESQGAALDPAFTKQLRNWISLAAGTMIRVCRAEDHLFILMHLLRLPSKHLRHLVGLLNPPDAPVVWKRSPSVVEFLHQPEVQLLLTLFAVCLRPVRERAKFVNIVHSESNNDKSASTLAPMELPWTVIDSGGESDLEANCLQTSRQPSDTFEPHTPPSPAAFSPSPEPSRFVRPRDLDRLLKQLNFEKLIQLLAYDGGSASGHEQAMPESGLLTLLAFANRLLSLIEACGDIYTNHSDTPRPKTHLGAWRVLAKRLAQLICLLVTAVGSRVRHVWTKQSSCSNSFDFGRTLAQYDAFCLRAAQCLLSGCGLPSTHQDAVRLACWRRLGSLFPFGLVATRTKVKFLQTIIASVIPSWNMNSDIPIDAIPANVTVPLHRALLTIGLNELGLEAFLTALGKLAAYECRPILYSPNPNDPNIAAQYQLPTMEAELIRSILRIIYCLSVFPEQAASNEPTGRFNVIASLPIAPASGREQLVAIVSAHPQIALDLLLRLVIESGEQFSKSEVATVQKRTVFGLSPFGELVDSQELILNLVAEAPLHIWRPTTEQIDRLIGWLVDQPPTSFPHLLTRIILHRLNWEAVLDVTTGEPFLSFESHLNLALALAQFVDKHLRYPGRFNTFPLPPVIDQLQLSARTSASSLVNTILTGLGYHSSEDRPESSPPDLSKKSEHSSRISSNYRWSRSSRPSDHNRRSRSQGPSSNITNVMHNGQPMLSWCIDLLLRLHLPGCVAVAYQPPAPIALKTNLSRALQQLDALGVDRNPLVAFLILSINVKLFGTSSSNLPTDSCLSRIFKPILESCQSTLIVRTFSIVFHQFASTSVPVDRPALEKALTTLLQLHKQGKLSRQVVSRPLSLLLGSCLDAAVYQPYTCHTLFRALVPMLAQSNWFESSDSMFLLEVLLQIDLWVHRSYIPGKLGSSSDLVGWNTLDSVEALETLFKKTYLQELSSNTGSWVNQLAPIGTAATWAWQQSSKAIYELRGRLLGASENFPDPNIPSTQLPEISYVPKSLLQTFCPRILDVISKASLYTPQSSPPFWLLTVLHRLDYKLQTGLDSGFAESIPQERTSIWSSLPSVLYKHIDELVLAIYNSNAPSEQVKSTSVDSIDPALSSLLETILLEADILPPSSLLDKGAGDTSDIMRGNRVRVILLHLPLIQSISLLDACPAEDPVLIVLLHTVLSEVFDILDKPLSSCSGTAVNHLPVGFLLLRCLRWSLFRLPMGDATSERSRTEDRRTLLDVVNSKLKSLLVYYGSTLSGDRTVAIHAIHKVINLLSELDSMASRTVFGSSGKTLPALTPSFQRDTIDALLSIFDWGELNNRLKPYMELWNKHRLATTAFSSTPPVEAEQPKDVFINLRKRQQSENRQSIPFYSLEKLRSVSIAALLPSSVNRYTGHIQELRTALVQHIKRMCDRIDLIEELQNYHRVTLVPNLYKITNVQKSEQVECKSLLPSWMTGSKRCLGGAHLTCTYQTTKVNAKIEGASKENRCMVQELLRQALEDAHVTASALMTDDLQQNITPAQTSWARLGLQLELAVSHLVKLSHASLLGGGPKEQGIRAIGVTCFEQLCQTLTGPLLSCPVSKKLIAECIQQLAGEFLTSVSAGYERVLDLLVALPHLSSILQPAFIPPTPGVYPSMTSDDAHPLFLVYSRLMDIRFRCSSDVALKILQTVDASVWFGESDLHRRAPTTQYTALLPVLWKCITQTQCSSNSSDAKDRLLQELCLEHLHLLLVHRLTDLLSPLCVLLIQDVNNPNNICVWNCLKKVLEDEIATLGSLSLSNELLIAVLNTLTATLSETARPITSSNDAIALNESLFDQLICAPSELICILLTVLHILLTQLAVKLATSVRAAGMSEAFAIPTLLGQLIGLFGSILLRSCAANYSRQAEPGRPSVTANVFTLVDAMVGVLQTATRVCPPDANHQWSSMLIDCFVRWLLITPCVNSNPYHSSVQRSATPTGSPKVTARQTPPGTTSKILLGTLLCAAPSDGEATFPRISFPAQVWKPTLASLNAMIELLSQTCRTPCSVPVECVAAFIAHLLEPVDWIDAFALSIDQFEIRPLYPQLTAPSSTWCPSDVSSTDRRMAFVESLTFILVRLGQALHNAPIERKNGLQLIIEAVVSGIRLSAVSERCYAYILSHLSEHSMPAYSVLLPPTSMEGRLFGLLAAAAGMVADPELTDVTVSTKQGLAWGTKPTVSNLYPKLSDLPSSSSTNQALHQKRLAYVRKITSLVQNALLRGVAPSHGLESLMSGLNLSEKFSTSSVGTENDPPFLTRITQPFGALFRKIIPVTVLPSTPDVSTPDPAHVLAILAWLRISNLLSELEAFAGLISWTLASSTPEFRNVSELCREIIFLLNSPRTSPSKDATASVKSQLSVLVAHRPLFYRSAVTHWLLGGSELDQTLDSSQFPVPPPGIMPRSINAGLARPICYSLLTTTPPAEEESAVAVVHLLDAALWSVINFGPNNLSVNERLSSLTTLFSELTDQQRSNLNLHCCLREGRLLPLYVYSEMRWCQLGTGSSKTDSYSILVADLLHWLGIVNLSSALGGTSLQLHAVLLYLSLLARVVDRRGSCCSAHPAWSSQATGVPNSKCPAAEDVSRWVLALSGLKKSLTKLKLNNSSSNKNVKTFVAYIDSLGSLLEAWIGQPPSGQRVHFTSLEHLADAQRVAATQEESDPDSSASVHSIIASTIARLSTWTLNDAFTHLSLQFWPDIRPSVKQLILHCDTDPPRL